jgi:hypothetical protein
MRIEVHQRGGILGLDRRVVVADGTIEVIDKGRSRGARPLDPEEAERLDALAAGAAEAGAGEIDPGPVSDGMLAEIAIESRAGVYQLSVRTGDGSPAEVWALIGELGRASRS